LPATAPGVRVDIRGCGESNGLLSDEYAKQEQDDGVEVIAWLAAQPWCSGVVGMMGISWGGFNGLQIAARRPPALKAIVTICSTDDRYADDVHYMGGTLLAADGLEWGSFFFGLMCLPPDPMLVGDSWRAMWLQRLANVPLFFETWLQHQRRDAYWKHGSVCEDYNAIQCPVYAAGGWTDAYKNAIPRLLERLTVPRKGLIGPWAHGYPHFAFPGPQVGFLQEMLRWWDYWLKGIDTGVMDEPMLRAWMMESVKPASHHEARPGRWVAEPSWPPPGMTPQRLFLTDEGLRSAATPLTVRAVCSPQTVGKCSGDWVPFGLGHDQPDDLHFHKKSRGMKREGVEMRQSYLRLAKRAAIMVGRYTHAHQFKRARRELKFLRTRLGRIIRDIRRKIEGNTALEDCFGPLLARFVFGIKSSVSAGQRSTRCTRPRWSASAVARRGRLCSPVPHPCTTRYEWSRLFVRRINCERAVGQFDCVGGYSVIAS
jgi:pimeloyl-ACP methyl ester carboxylesterase